MEQSSGHLHLSRLPNRGNPFNHRHAHNYYVMGCRRADEGALDDARKHLKRALSFDPTYLPALRTICNIELSTNNIEAAKHYAEMALSLSPTDHEVLTLLGNIALSEHDAEAAISAFIAAKDNGGNSTELQYNTGLAHLFLGQCEDAIQIFNSLLEDQPANYRAWDALGCALRIKKDYQGAVKAFLQALQVEPQANDTRDHLAQLLLEAGNPQRARQVLETALAFDTQRPTSRHLLGMTYIATQDFKLAINCWNDLIAQGNATAETYHLLANAYLHITDVDHAQRILNELVEHFPDHVSGHLQLALLLFEQGDREHGQEHLNIARSLDPENPAIQQALNVAETIFSNDDQIPAD
ncbi:MAG TPA: tetratricopeptide repeat protein [Armatimonadota bacterium]|nr:tetratricopeptide repeat protein [Armatimonadota bacterium]